MNLIGNAIKFTPASGTVTVSTSRSGKKNVQVSVSDTGPGVLPNETEKIFEKFCRYGSSHNNPLAIHDTKFFAIEPLTSRFGL